MHQFKAIIADQEESTIANLRSLLFDLWPELAICATAKSGSDALKLIEKHQPHFVFLEVRIPDVCGMQVARTVAGSCLVVFITTHDHYAVNAFDSGAVDYLVKPVSRERLEKAVGRLKTHVAASLRSTPDLSHVVEHLMAELPLERPRDYLQWIRVQHGDGVRLIPVEEVCYFKASDKYTLVVTRQGESLIKKTIRELADELDPNKYWRIHRGTIVNVSQIDKVSRSLTGRGTLKLKDRPETLTVSRPYLHMFRQM